jgi:hypothetical protein
LPRGVPWWNKELRDLKAQIGRRRLFNRAKTTGNGALIRNPLPDIMR